MQNHTPVLLQEAVTGLNLKPGDTAIDATLGLGGHTAVLAEVVGEKGTILAIDQDEGALTQSRERLSNTHATIHYVHGNFRDIDVYAEQFQLNDVNGILFDLGWNATQLESGRGFSFRTDEPLLMTLTNNPEEDALTAHTIVNTWSERDLEDIIRTLGEERFAKRIAYAIVQVRTSAPIETSGQLAKIVSNATPVFYRNRKTHPATKTFQALRIMVNDELSSLMSALEKSVSLIAPGGRVAVITFHSLEDGITKRTFKRYAQEKTVMLIVKKPLVPTREEILNNPRARSAKLRIIEKL